MAALALCCWLVAYWGLGLRTRWVCGAVAGALLAALPAVFWNACLRLDLGWTAGTVLAVVFCALLAAWSRLRPGPEVRVSASRASLFALALGTGCLWLTAASNQLNLVDDDYWMHTPVQRQIFNGTLPPRNPFFSDLILNGHFGRDVLLVSLARATGCELPQAQWWLTNLCHALALPLYFGLLVRFGGSSERGAWLGSALMWLGANVIGKSGLAEFCMNNTSVVYLYVGLMFWLASLERSPVCLLLLGLLGGALAQVYETHFGLFWLAYLAVFRVSRRALPAMLLALAVAVTQGGALCEMLNRYPVPVVNPTGLQNQAQQVTMHFPKRNLFCMRIGAREIQPVSCAYQNAPGSWLLAWLDHSESRTDPDYVSIFSWTALRMHYLAVYLAAATAIVLLWRRSPPLGWLFWWFGAFAFLVPGLVDFGPIHESEFLRWEFAAAWALAGALGLSVGLLERRASWGVGLLLAFLCLRVGIERQWAALRLIPRLGWGHCLTASMPLHDWYLAHAGQLRLHPADLALFPLLRQEGGRSVLVNFSGRDAGELIFESTLSGWTGLALEGHDLPLPADPIGLPPYRLQEKAALFLAGQPARWLPSDWLYVHAPHDAGVWSAEPAWLANFRLWRSQLDPDGWEVRIYRRSPPSMSRAEGTGPLASLPPA